MRYHPIENYGIIGDLNTVALVGIHGSIDFLCFPDFDSPSIFTALLDADKGGFFCVQPSHLDDVRNKQMYLPDTNVLITRFLSSEGVGEITDFMPVEECYEGGNVLIRRVTAVRGTLTFTMTCAPRFNYARDEHRIVEEGGAILFRSKENGGFTLRLTSNVPIQIRQDDATAEFTLEGGQSADFVLELLNEKVNFNRDIDSFVTRHLYETVNYWKKWVDESKYNGRWREMVNRSALTLKLMTSYKHGSLVAAPTFSLPEWMGGERNWDYRYTWIRDASFTVYSMLSLGYTREASAFMCWVEKKCQDMAENGYLGLMYKLNGDHELTEQTLDHLEGYCGSKPVRIGNDAYEQIQLDIYGELMDAVYLYNKYAEPISYDFWQALKRHIEWLTQNWNKPDEGIWEVRGGKRHFLYSRLMCWVAMDRAIKLANMRPFPIPDHWVKVRDEIYNTIWDEFWNDEKQCFVQYLGSTTVDAATLLMPLIRFISAKDPRWTSTMKAIEQELVSDSLVYRYHPEKAADDGMSGGEGTFSMCTFWYVECLSRAGELQKARLYFEKMLGYANHLGLYSEMLGFRGEHLGNFPQAFTHLGLISAAINLDHQLNDQRNQETPISF
ncbi:Glucoamylase (glucan-1,4-alpha-glucosidase), GH15 family [Catalinimonas alkaloidigena]|uniref:Glucoamylase (Glucan-1,4-alpha-glucosidase), GH15 family n=1 Tax=Catalinimonas alkaloidigena TaxID=1075417 RepID=A0A1G9F5B1_9BACT|nr:glycoside hydrolase family 15 protein [Catalinimonas alkaloidigena]SDK83639.1 Glucoamylase (glucan-1,4-alpha-glucosidase), GH15 family [Catalinimonas alkaloidigena]